MQEKKVRTFVEVGMGVNRKRGYGRSFPFEEHDTYLGIDYRYGLGAAGRDMYGRPIQQPVILDMDTLHRRAKSDRKVEWTIRPNAQDLADYTAARKVRLVTMYAEWHRLPLADNSADQLLLGNIIGDPSLQDGYKTAILDEASRVVKPGRLVVAKETIAPFAAHEYFAGHEQWDVTAIDQDSERWPEMNGLYDAYPRGTIFEVGVPAVTSTVEAPVIVVDATLP